MILLATLALVTPITQAAEAAPVATPVSLPVTQTPAPPVPDDAPAGTRDAPFSAPSSVPSSAPFIAVPPPPPQTLSLAPYPAADAPPGQADIVITARQGPVAIDPLIAINETSFKATQAIDRAITRPAAKAYERHIPTPIRDGLRNFFFNLHDIDVFLNFWLQLKPGKAMETAGRFLINTTLGVAGVFDIAKRKPFHLPRRRNSLANTLGYYGVGPGPFFFLPLIGPITLRDFVGNGVDGLVVPTLIGKPFTSPAYTIPSSIIRSLQDRAKSDDAITAIQADANPYAAARAAYLDERQREIDHLRGRDRKPKDPAAAPPATIAPPVPPAVPVTAQPQP